MKHLAVVGGGIAGLAVALHLLRKGHQVTLFEKQKGPVDKVCGEGILPFGVALLQEMGLAGAVQDAGMAFTGLTYHYGGKLLQADFAAGRVGIGIDRVAMNRVMLAACEVFDGFEYRQGERAKPGELVQTYDGVLGADGVQGRSARWMGRQPKATSRIGVRFRLDVSPPSRVAVHFFREGEIYLTPTGPDSLSVAMLLNRQNLPVSGRALAPFCKEFFKTALPHLANEEIRDFATRGHIAVRWTGSAPKGILMGDALRAFDPISGAGMSFALLCAKHAAENFENPSAYYRSVAPAMGAVDSFTKLVLFFSGGGFRTRLMFRQLGKAPALFQRLIESHDGRHRVSDLLDWHMARQILRV